MFMKRVFIVCFIAISLLLSSCSIDSDQERIELLKTEYNERVLSLYESADLSEYPFL